MLLLMAGLGATIAAKSASSLHQTVLLGATTSTSQNTCAAIVKEENENDDNNNNKLPPPPQRQSDSVSAEPTNPTAAACACNEMHHAILHVPTMLQMSNAILRRKDHEQYLSLLESQQQAHHSEMLKLQQSMDFTISNLQDKLNELRNAIEKMQEEEQQKKRPPSLRDYLMSSSSSLYDPLPVQLLDMSHMKSEPQHAIFLVILLLLPTIVVVLLKILIKKGTSKHQKKRTTHHNGYNYNHCHPTSPNSTSMGIPNLSTADSCSSPSLGSVYSQKSSPATPCPPYIAIPAVHRRMTTAMTIEQMARDADDQHPHGDHLPLPLPPPPLIPPLYHQEDTITVKTESYPDKTKLEHVLKRKARILSRRLRSMARKAKKSPAVRFFLGTAFLAVLGTSLINMAPLNWKLHEFSSLDGTAHPIQLIIELIITFSVFVAAGYRLSYCSSGISTNDAGTCTPNKRSTIRRHRSLIRGPSTVRSNGSSSSSSRSAVFRRQRRPSKRSLFARSR